MYYVCALYKMDGCISIFGVITCDSAHLDGSCSPHGFLHAQRVVLRRRQPRSAWFVMTAGHNKGGRYTWSKQGLKRCLWM